MNAKEELVELLRLCNVDARAIDVVEMAYELGYKAGQQKGLSDDTILAGNEHTKEQQQ
jgi:hypothetical protein